MKVLITSDLHGSTILYKNLSKIKEKHNVDKIFILGDMTPTYFDTLAPIVGSEYIENRKIRIRKKTKDSCLRTGELQINFIDEICEKYPNLKDDVYYLFGNHDFFTEEQMNLGKINNWKKLEDNFVVGNSEFFIYEGISEFNSGLSKKNTNGMLKRGFYVDWEGQSNEGMGFWNNEAGDEENQMKIDILKNKLEKSKNKNKILLSHNNNYIIDGHIDGNDIPFEEFLKTKPFKNVFGGHIHPNDCRFYSYNKKNDGVISVANDYNSYHLKYHIVEV